MINYTTTIFTTNIYNLNFFEEYIFLIFLLLYQFQICLLHMNELPLRTLFKKLDWETNGPNLHNGPIGKNLLTVTELPIINFNIIEVDDEFASILSNNDHLHSDQKYLRNALVSITTRNLPSNFAKRSLGKLGYARWLTTANRILRYYMSILEPSDTLLRITKFIIFVYARMWFEIRHYSSYKYAAIHVLTWWNI